MLATRAKIIAMSRHDFNFLQWFRPRKKKSILACLNTTSLCPCIMKTREFLKDLENSSLKLVDLFSVASQLKEMLKGALRGINTVKQSSSWVEKTKLKVKCYVKSCLFCKRSGFISL